MNLKRMKMIVGSLLLGVSFSASASTSGGGVVTSSYTMNGGVIIFYVNGSRTARPACSTQDRWAFSATTAAGQAKLATLLTAFGQNKIVQVTGTGTCVSWGDTEEVDFIVINQ